MDLQACVYLYRSANSSRIRYVGRGLTPERALQHTAGSHNAGLRDFIESNSYSLEVAGPYETYREAECVEAALISALRLDGEQAELFNLVPGHGPRFAPLGVPTKFATRPIQEPLSVADIGRITGGALIVRNSFGEDLDEGRPRLDPVAAQQDDVIVDNITKHWRLGLVTDSWREDPDSRPRVLLGAAGPTRHRYVPGALNIDRDRLLSIQGSRGQQHEVPVLETTGLDACELRGRRLTGAKFTQNRNDWFIWVDGHGTTRHPSR